MTDESIASPADSARDEAARQAVILIFGVVGIAVMIWMQRTMGDPDFARESRMRAARAGERVFARLAGWAWRKAEAARLAYEQDRP